MHQWDGKAASTHLETHQKQHPSYKHFPYIDNLYIFREGFVNKGRGQFSFCMTVNDLGHVLKKICLAPPLIICYLGSKVHIVIKLWPLMTRTEMQWTRFSIVELASFCKPKKHQNNSYGFLLSDGMISTHMTLKFA